jgi:hypothetical protein
MHSYLIALSLKNSENVLGVLVIILMLSVVVVLFRWNFHLTSDCF